MKARGMKVQSMKAMFWKELREVGTWAVLALVVIGVCNAFGCYNLHDSLGDSRNTLWLTRVDMLPFASIVLGPVVGILIGMVQILPELRRDQWAFLVHRPLSPASLFWGKAVPGLLMVVVVIVLPDLLAFFWLRSRAPFPELMRWELLQVSFGAVLSGVMFYFAAMLSALRPVRWYGSRLLGLSAALILTIGCMQVPYFWQALSISAVGTAVLALAAWGCFAKRGDYGAMPPLPKVALATILVVGAGSVVGVGAGLLTSLLNIRWENHQRLLAQEQVSVARSVEELQNYRVDRQGRVVAVQITWKHGNVFFDVRGHTIPEDKAVAFVPTKTPGQYFQPLIPLLLRGAAPGAQSASLSSPERSYMSVRSLYNLLSEDRNQICLYNLREKRIVYYDKKKRRIAGYLGPVGYYPAQGPTPPQGATFPGKLLSDPKKGPVYWYEHAVFWVEPQVRKVSPIIHTPSAEPIINAVPLQGGNFNAHPPRNLLELFLVTPGDIRILNQSGQEIARTIVGKDQIRNRSIHVAAISNSKRIYWLAEIDRDLTGHHSLRSQILETGGNGRVDRRFKLPEFLTDRFHSLSPGSVLMAMVLPVWPQRDQKWLSPGEVYWGNTIFDYELRSLTPAVPVMVPLGMAILCSLAMFFLTRSFGVDRLERWVWILFSLPLGPLALLGLVCVRSRPSRLPCPKCQKPRLVQRELCEHCGSEWSIPPRDGTEIFVERLGVQQLDVEQFDSRSLATGGTA